MYLHNHFKQVNINYSKQMYLAHRWDPTWQLLPPQVRVDLRVMPTKS